MPLTTRDIQGFREVWALRIFGVITSALLVLSLLFCLANGHRNGYNYLLAINVLITAFIGGLVTKWYNVGELSASKLWYVVSIACVVIVQSIVYDVFAFHTPTTASGNHTTT